ncbi:hypothetical protein EVB91_108 [Rhizobium phage RHph_I1_18]|nr:hypothetical protein EVB91_108 [Rhizobium phage RHph_I1_18]
MPYQPDQDFGFTFEDEVQLDNSDLEKANQTIAALTETVESQKTANRTMYRKIAVLLHNLRKFPEKPTIKWPNRAESIDKFLEELKEYNI